MATAELDPARVAAFLVGHHGLRRWRASVGAEGVREMLREQRCVQLDPLDRVGTNADLVALARVEGIARGDVYRHVFPGHAFEHFAKERCLLPASAFPAYRERAAETPWWRLSERLKRLPAEVLEKVLEELRTRGASSASELTDHGAVKPMDWDGWKGTSKATTMALEVLWTRCQVVVCGRSAKGSRVYDLPERALPEVSRAKAPEDFARWALLERVEAAGMLPVVSGPWWSMLSDVRRTKLPETLVKEGAVERARVAGGDYLCPAGFLEREYPDDDGAMRVLGPLDPLLWSRKLVSKVFGFDYIWEVYKPEEQRVWGWYVVPLLHEGRLVGRVDARTDDRGRVKVESLWEERKGSVNRRAMKSALERLHRAE